jgi:hypothetical protein
MPCGRYQIHMNTVAAGEAMTAAPPPPPEPEPVSTTGQGLA